MNAIVLNFVNAVRIPSDEAGHDDSDEAQAKLYEDIAQKWLANADEWRADTSDLPRRITEESIASAEKNAAYFKAKAAEFRSGVYA